MQLLFDLDGTLTDPREGILGCIRHALSKLDVEIDPRFNLESCIGPPLRDSFARLLGDTTEVETAVSHYRQRFASVGLYQNQLYDGIPQCLETLRARGHSIHLATSKPGVYADRIIRHFRLQHYFDSLHGSHLDGRLGDKTVLLQHLLSREQLDPADCVMIGDRCFDMIGASNNNVRAIGVLWGYGSGNELQQAGAEYLCAAPTDLATQVGRLPGR